MIIFKNINAWFSCLAIAFLSIATLQAQQELGTHFMEGTWQSTYTNPAFVPKNKVVVSLPGFYDNLSIQNIKLSDLLTTNAQGNSILDVNGAIDKMGTHNLLREDFSLETLGIGLRFGKVALSLSHSLKIKAQFDFPKTLAQLVWQGNAQFIGEEVSFGPDIEFSTWHHYALGAAYEITKNVTIGTRLKYITGIANLSTEKRDLKLTTSDDIYQLELAADYLINTSNALDFESINDFSFNFEPTGSAIKELFSKNKGFAFDLGVNLTFGKLKVAASVLDVGSITWQKNVSNYAIQGTYEYEGIEVTQELFKDTASFSAVFDTLLATYEPITTHKSYVTALPTQFYLSAKYALTKKLTLGALFYSEFYKGTTYPAFALSGHYSVGKMLQLGAIYAIRNQTFDNLGINAVVKLGPVQLFAMTDNILSAFTTENTHSANVRLGINLVFGKQKEKEILDLY